MAFWGDKRRVCSMFKIRSAYICWKKYIKCNIWRIAVRPSYVYDARFLKVNEAIWPRMFENRVAGGGGIFGPYSRELEKLQYCNHKIIVVWSDQGWRDAAAQSCIGDVRNPYLA
jgi:hypothetical protein